MPDIQLALNAFIDTIRTDIINSMQAHNRVSSGATVSSLEILPTDSEIQLLAPWWIEALEDGRKPTSPNAPAGDPTLYDRIVEWCNDKGIDVKAAYAITKHIHEYGYPGTPGVLSEPLSEDNINARLDMDAIAENEAMNFLEAVGL